MIQQFFHDIVSNPAKWKAAAVLAAIPAGITAYMGNLGIPFFVLMAASILDYGTGLAAAKHRGSRISSKKAVWGFAKKLLLWCTVVVGVLIDVLLNRFGLDIHSIICSALKIDISGAGQMLTVAVVICIWLVSVEIISILENLGDIGVKIPFLLPFVKWVQRWFESKIPKVDEGEVVKTEDEGK